jgi:hypothetical protein
MRFLSVDGLSVLCDICVTAFAASGDAANLVPLYLAKFPAQIQQK